MLAYRIAVLPFSFAGETIRYVVYSSVACSQRISCLLHAYIHRTCPPSFSFFFNSLCFVKHAIARKRSERLSSSLSLWKFSEIYTSTKDNHLDHIYIIALFPRWDATTNNNDNIHVYFAPTSA